jgi:hypothetical protein
MVLKMQTHIHDNKEIECVIVTYKDGTTRTIPKGVVSEFDGENLGVEFVHLNVLELNMSMAALVLAAEQIGIVGVYDDVH